MITINGEKISRSSPNLLLILRGGSLRAGNETCWLLTVQIVAVLGVGLLARGLARGCVGSCRGFVRRALISGFGLAGRLPAQIIVGVRCCVVGACRGRDPLLVPVLLVPVLLFPELQAPVRLVAVAGGPGTIGPGTACWCHPNPTGPGTAGPRISNPRMLLPYFWPHELLVPYY